MLESKDLKPLKSSPVFQMSLASKELFHSNMLAMLFQLKNKNGIEVFPKLKTLFPPKDVNASDVKDNYKVLDVLREKEKFDLVIIYLPSNDLKKLPKDFSVEDYYTQRKMMMTKILMK